MLKRWGVQASPQPSGWRDYEARRMETRATTPRPSSATAARMGREMPPVSGRLCFMFAEALADGLAVALAEALAVTLADGLMEALIEALDEDVVPPPPPPDTLTLAVISGCIEQW